MNMDEYCGRFFFAKDMNDDLAFTITDLWLMAKFVFLLPAKIVTGLIHNSELASFFEVACLTGEGWGGAVFSLFAWVLVFALVGALFEKISAAINDKKIV